MALQQLNEEQIRTWTRAQKDEWWLKNIYRGDMAQLTVRSAFTGFVMGGLLAATALYIGGKTGITLGVGLTSVILAFSIFRIVAKSGLAKDFTILENNCTQSIATAAGYMVTPLISSLAAYMMVTGHIVPWWQMVIWSVVVSILGVLLAFPMKRRFINEDQLPFPEGRACGVVLDTLYTGDAKEGVYQAKLLWFTGGLVAIYQMLCSDGWMKLIQFKLLRMDKWAGLAEPWNFHERIDTYYYLLGAKYQWWMPKILGTDFRTLGLRATLDAAMLGVGGLMGIRVAGSCVIGAIVNFVILAPIMIQRGDIKAYTAPSGAIVSLNRAEIVNQWSLWWGVTMMVVGSMVGLFAKPELFTSMFKNLRRKSGTEAKKSVDVLAGIELPLWLSYVGVPIFSVIAAWITHAFFGVPWLMSFISLPLIFVLTVICTNSMALTSWTPTGALSKITQFTMGAIDHANPANNLIPAGMTAEISSNAANLLSDIKPGYMLGGKPRHQAIGHVIGIFAGALASTPLFFVLFLPERNGVRSADTLISEAFPMPGAVQWKGVADIIANGLSSLPTSAIVAMIFAAVCAVVFEVARVKTRGRFPISAVSLGLGVILPPEYCFTMFLGALIFWWFGRKHQNAVGTKGHRFWVQGCEPICAGLISGAALIGIANALLNVAFENGWF
jgi:uncharacterized oligopeptide transporter (OPT) family protein